ncbi:MAG: hypothetical protein ABI688_09015 [Bacteroidota bacterium]
MIIFMSQAFVKENDDNGLLHQVDPTVPALIRYLQREQRGALIFLDRWENKNGVATAVMSNGFAYFINKDKQWEIIL